MIDRVNVDNGVIIIMASLCASKQGKKKIQQAKADLGLKEQELLIKAGKIICPQHPQELYEQQIPLYPGGVSAGTYKRFSRGISINPEAFKAYCQALNLDWQDIIDPSYKAELEERCLKSILDTSNFLVRIKGPESMGRKPMLNRVLGEVQEYIQQEKLNYQVTNVDFNLLAEFLGDRTKFFQSFCATTNRKLGLSYQLDWNNNLSLTQNITNYFEDCILARENDYLILVLENFDVVFQSNISNNFCDMIRSWSEEADSSNKLSKMWKKLCIVIAHSTDVYASMNIHSSPVGNIGETFLIEPLKQEDLQILIKEHQVKLNSQEINQIMELLGGIPELINGALKKIKNDNIAPSELLNNMAECEKMFGNHLRKLYDVLRNNSDLKNTYFEIINRHLRKLKFNPDNTGVSDSLLEMSNTDESEIKIEPDIAFQLESMGLIHREDNGFLSSCSLYCQYFKKYLSTE